MNKDFTFSSGVFESCFPFFTAKGQKQMCLEGMPRSGDAFALKSSHCLS